MKKCPQCGDEIQASAYPGHMSGHSRAKSARYVYKPGDKHPYEWKACEHCGEQALIRKEKRFCSYACSKTGENNPMWKGDEADRKSARMRAHRIVSVVDECCRRCGSTERIHRHHVDGNTFNNSLDNLEILCYKCHGLAHRLERPDCPVCGKKCPLRTSKHCSRACWMEANRRKKLAKGGE